jgi:hypothetical protein
MVSINHLVILLVIPVQSVMEYLWSGCVQWPIELHLDVLNQVAGDFQVSSIGWMPLWANVIMLHYAGGVEVMNKWIRWFVRNVCCILYWVVQNWTI